VRPCPPYLQAAILLDAAADNTAWQDSMYTLWLAPALVHMDTAEVYASQAEASAPD